MIAIFQISTAILSQLSLMALPAFQGNNMKLLILKQHLTSNLLTINHLLKTHTASNVGSLSITLLDAPIYPSHLCTRRVGIFLPFEAPQSSSLLLQNRHISCLCSQSCLQFLLQDDISRLHNLRDRNEKLIPLAKSLCRLLYLQPAVLATPSRVCDAGRKTKISIA